MRERIGYYDVARGLGIIFVVIGHIDTFYMPFRSYVIYFHMALFLIISGMLISETGEDQKSWFTVAGKKFCRIMLPYYFFSLLAVLIEGLRLLVNGVFYWPHLKSLLVTTLTLQGNSAMWFLPALFLSELLFLGIRKLAIVISGRRALTGKDLAVDLLTVLLGILVIGIVTWNNIFEQAFYEGHRGIEIYERLHEILSMLIRSVVCIFFVGVGFFVRKYVIPLKITAARYGGVAVFLLAACLGIKLLNPGVDLRALDWGDSEIWVQGYYMTVFVKAGIYLVGATAGALGIVSLCKACESFSRKLPFRILAYFGANSLIVMATHLDFHVLHVGMELTNILNRYVDHSVFYHSCLLIIVFLAEACLIWIINQYLPFLTGRFKKYKHFS